MSTFCIFNKIFSSIHLFSKNLRFITTTYTKSTFDNFNKFFSSGAFFIFNNNISFNIMFSTNAPSFVIYILKLFILKRSTGFNINIFILCRLKKVKSILNVYIHINFVKKLFNLVNCSGEIVSFEITSVNISSTLK